MSPSCPRVGMKAAGMLLAAAFLSPADAQNPITPAPVKDGGVCVGLAWVKLQPGETARKMRGPDFDVYYFQRPGTESWAVYEGFAPSAVPAGPPLLTKDGVVVRRGVERGNPTTFDGYLIQSERDQNHVFGALFKDGPVDRALFSRVALGKAAKAHCPS